MMSFETAKRLVSAVCGLDNENTEAFSEDHCTEITDENGNTIHLFYDSAASDMIAVGAIGKLPDDKDEALTLCTFLLSQNLLWVNTNGATITMIEDGSYVAIQRRYEGADESEHDFRVFLNSFSDELSGWIDSFDNLCEQTENGVTSMALNLV